MKTKYCYKCKTYRPLTKFCKDRSRKDGLQPLCNICKANWIRIARKLNPYPFRQNNKNTLKRRPWIKTWNNINYRCTNPKNRCYEAYGGRGIKNYLTCKDLEYLWFRDKAYLMKKPSIDRIDSDGHYTLENCRYMELSENLKRRWEGR